MASECLSELTSLKKIHWPTVDPRFIQTKKCNIVIQINAKKRAVLEIENGLSEKNLLEKIKKMQELKKFIENKEIIKTIFIKDKLINLIIK